jgi:benzoyl-CoA reductase/2-hydroxyglutaryl-CoA dehydratase subunit BcrC/BadD/HgdB
MRGMREGQCPFAWQGAASLTATPQPLGNPAAIILTSTCDQMRRAAEIVQARTPSPVFLMNVPATWRSDSARGLYADELARLGLFLQHCGGRQPGQGELAALMLAYERARIALKAAQPMLSAREFARLLCELGSCDAGQLDGFQRAISDACGQQGQRAAGGIDLAIVGGPIAQGELAILDAIELAGGKVVLNACESGQRCLPAPLDAQAASADPLAQLRRMYFDSIPDAFRRPDSLLENYLRTHLAGSGARGVVLIRQVWCDLWHAWTQRLGGLCPLPVLDVVLGDSPEGTTSATNRIQSFIEILRR